MRAPAKRKIREWIMNIDDIISALPYPTEDGLLQGKLGLALYYFYLHRVLGGQSRAKKAMDMMDAVFTLLGSHQSNLSNSYAYSYGLAGLGFTLDHLVIENFIAPDFDSLFEDMDPFIHEAANQSLLEGNTDFLHGACGALHYFSMKKGPSRKYAGELMKTLNSIAVRQPLKNTSFFPNNLPLPKHMKQLEGVNLSLAHGQPAILLILKNLYQQGIGKRMAKGLITSGINYILQFQSDRILEDPTLSTFPGAVTKEDIWYKVRLGWCYGDLDHAFLLYKTGKLLNNDAWLNTADITGLRTTTKTSEELTDITDTHFCHGSAGLARFYSRLYQENPLPQYYDSSQYWLQRTLDLLPVDLDKKLYEGKEGSILEGLAGVSLCLLPYVTKKDLHWDRVFLLS